MLEHIRDRVFPFLKSLASTGDSFPAAMKDAVFIVHQASLLAEAVEILDSIPVTGSDFDTQGDIYEELLRELNLLGKNGQFHTPRHIIRMMIELVDPKLGEWICDPAAGTGGFLVSAFQWILKAFTPPDVVSVDPAGSWQNLTGESLGQDQKLRDLLAGKRFVGYDFDNTMVRLGLMNMMLHGIRQPVLRYQDALSHDSQPLQRFDVIVTNPPFGGSVERTDRNPELALKTSKTELLFVELCLRLVREGGRCAIIVPEGVLFGSSPGHCQLREELIDKNTVEAVISLPGGCFKPYTGVKTSIILLRRGGTSERIWFYEVTGDGYTLDDRRVEDPGSNTLQYVPQAYRILARRSDEAWASKAAEDAAAKLSWSVNREEIVSQGFSLAPGLYRPTAVRLRTERRDPLLILSRIRELEGDLAAGLTRIESMIRGTSDG